MEFPFDKIKNDDELIYVVDFSFKPEIMKQLSDTYKNIIWIDHHKTAIEDNKNAQFLGLRMSGMAGCELTWVWINNLYNNSTPINKNKSILIENEKKYKYLMSYIKNMPKFVQLIGDLDVFRLKMEPESSEFYYGLSSENEHPYDGVWNDFYDRSETVYGDDIQVNILISKGRTILDYINKNQYRNLKNYGYTVKWRGKKCIVLNTPSKGSFMFKDFEGYDIMLVYCHRNDEKDGLIYEVSIYSENPKIDVSKIAHEFGGGGHKGAAGFRCNSLPWENCKNKKV